ncbi:MAG: mandelate racemase/muconate lactonizing enzyme family protein [Chloroflexi bacterium]|nr:mandelate racemase/muconate lactonizing enzyme family protein [Chloroflexota bacterium]
MLVTGIESFECRVPVSEKAAAHGVGPDIWVTRVTTDKGITGYEFYPTLGRNLEKARKIVVGQDPHNIEVFLQQGLGTAPGVETALWDIIGKAAGQPVYKLLGAAKEHIPCYLTCVWPGPADQSGVTYEQQAADIKYYQEHGFKAVKIRGFRRPIQADGDAVATIRDAVGGREVMQIMIDRTGPYSGTIWTMDEAIIMARRFESLDVTWLEEPLNRGDVFEHAKLAQTVDIPITGGEGDRGLSMFSRYLKYGSYDILQPDTMNCGGILTTKKIGALAESFGVDCVLHGTHGLLLASRLQNEASLPNCWILEVALTNPGLLPWEQWEHCLALVNQKELYRVENGEFIMSDLPGLGLDVNDAALERYRVP